MDKENSLERLGLSRTFLSVDIVKSTQLIGELEAEAARELLEQGLKIIVDSVYQYGGRIVYTAGDGGVAEFRSLPVFGNHIILATAAGLEIQQKIADESLPYKLRIGIDTVAIDMENESKEAYQLSSIIQEHAEPESVFLSESSKDYLNVDSVNKIKIIINKKNCWVYQITQLPKKITTELQKKLHGLNVGSKIRKRRVGEIKFISIIFLSVDESTKKLTKKHKKDYITRINEVLNDYNATLIKDRGLFMMIVVGAPIAYEDHAVRACLIAHRVLKISEDLKLSNLAKLGINSGPAVLDDIGGQHFHQYDALGPSVNFAARLEQIALPGQALISEETAGLVGDAINLKKLEPKELKGFKGTHAFYSLENIERIYISQKLEWEFYSSQIFIDHVAELQMFEEKLAMLEEHPVIWGLKAEPGIGKSRLTYEFSKIASKKGLRLFMLGALSYQKYQPFSMLRQFFMRALNIESSCEIDKKKQIIIDYFKENINKSPYEKSAMFAVFGFETDDAWQSMSAKDELNIIARCFYEVLKCLVNKKSIFLAFDDMHWCDEQSLGIFIQGFSRLINEPIFALLSYRPEFHFNFSMIYKHELELQPLSIHDSRDFMNHLFDDIDGGSSIKEKIIKQSEGNPFYMEEIARYLVNNNILIKDGETYHLQSADAAYQIPETIHGVISGSIDRLSMKNKKLLQQSSILGSVFALSDLQILSELEAHELAVHLRELEEARLIFTKELFPETQYAFKHAYILDVTYKMMLTKNRVKYHKKFVNALELLPEANRKLSALAYHSFQAGLWAKSFHYYAKHIPRQISIDFPISRIINDSGKTEIAYQHLTMKEKNLYFDDFAIVKLKQQHAVMASGHPSLAVVPLQMLEQQAIAKKNDWVQSLALAHLMVIHALLNASFSLQNAYENIIKLGEKSLKRKKDINIDNYMATLYFARILYDSIHGDYESLYENCKPILDKIKIPNTSSIWLGLPIWSVCRLLTVIGLREQMKLTKENSFLKEFTDALVDQSPTESTANNYRALGMIYLFFGDLENSKKYFLLGLEVSEKNDYLVHTPIFNSYLSQVYMLDGHHDKAVTYAKKSYKSSKAMNHMFFGLNSLGRVAGTLLNYNHFSLAKDILDEALPLAEKAEQVSLCIDLFQTKADLLIASQHHIDIDEVLVLLKKASSLVKKTGAIYFYPYIQRSYARLYQKLGNTKKANLHWQHIFHFFDEHPADFWRAYFTKEYNLQKPSLD